MPEKVKLFGSTQSKITKVENGENDPRLEIIKVVIAHCNIINNDYQHGSRILYIFVSNKSFGLSLDILPKNFIFSKTFKSGFSYIEVWFIDQNSKPLDIENKKFYFSY